MKQLELIPAAQPSSITAPLPAGWQRHNFENITGQTMAFASDPDGCCWYWDGAAWILNVPYFRRTHAAKSNQPDNIAVVEHITMRHIEAPITPKGTIIINGRRILRRQWNH